MARSTKAAAENESLDPVAEPYVLADSDPQPGVAVRNDDFAVTVDGDGKVNVLPVGWVGPAPLIIHGSKVDNLIAVLQEAKSAKADDDSDDAA